MTMLFRNPLPWFKQVFLSAGFFYAVIILLALLLVDFRAVDMRVKMRRLNDAKPDMAALVAFENARSSPEKIDWTPYVKYFSMVVRYMPDEKISRMFLGVCEYYLGDPHKTAWSNILRAAEQPPYVFWGMYNAGLLAFQRGDLGAASRYLERALILPQDKIEAGIRSSVVYRQVMAASNFDAKIMARIAEAKEDVYLFLAAVNFYAKDHAKALGIALYPLEKMDVKDKEPFYFFAGAASMSLGRMPEAVKFFSQCMELKSQNPLVYRYMSEILKVSGKQDAAENILRMALALEGKRTTAFPYPERLRLRFF